MPTYSSFAGTIGGVISASSSAGSGASATQFGFVSTAYAGSAGSPVTYREMFLSFYTAPLPDGIVISQAGTNLSVCAYMAGAYTPNTGVPFSGYFYNFADTLSTSDWRTPTQITALPLFASIVGSWTSIDGTRVTLSNYGTQANMDANISRTGYTKMLFASGALLGYTDTYYGIYVPQGTNTTLFPSITISYTYQPPEIDDAAITWSTPTEIAQHSVQFLGPNNTPLTLHIPVSDPNSLSVTVKAYSGTNRSGTLLGSASGSSGSTLTLTIPYTVAADGVSTFVYFSADNGNVVAPDVTLGIMLIVSFDFTNPVVNHIRTTDAVIADGEYTVLFTAVS